MKDETDLQIEALFRAGPIDDDGFSERVVARIRRQLRVRRYALPVAVLIGALIAVRPAVELLLTVSVFAAEAARAIPERMPALPHSDSVIAGLVLAAVTAMLVRVLER